MTQIFACGAVAAADACSRQGEEALLNTEHSLADEDQVAPSIAAVDPVAELPTAEPIAVVANPEQARCTAAQMQDGTAKACLYPVDASVDHVSSIGGGTSCCPPLSSQRDELPRCWQNTTSKTAIGTLSQGCVFAAEGVARVSPDANPNAVCCPRGLSLVDENAPCGPTLGAAQIVGCLFPKTGTATLGTGVNVCCPAGSSLAANAAAIATANASSASLFGERPACTTQDMAAIANKTARLGCFSPKDASVPKVDPAQDATQTCCPPGDSAALTSKPTGAKP